MEGRDGGEGEMEEERFMNHPYMDLHLAAYVTVPE